MVIAIYNISSTSARVSWPSSPTCIDTFYSVMYDPNWNSLFMGYKRKSFMYEDRIPVSQTSTHLANLLPQTAYFLCVTCQAANPVREQCQVFSTLSDSSEGHDRAGWELAMAVWLICCILLLVIASILLWSCLNNICILPDRWSGLEAEVHGQLVRDNMKVGVQRGGKHDSVQLIPGRGRTARECWLLGSCSQISAVCQAED
uniref:Fibronectin type-III domain-containing protein n=1 Tax=Pundamilia nyererei TaxID=303518 RepID=A0A3B4GMP4_9CICH